MVEMESSTSVLDAYKLRNISTRCQRKKNYQTARRVAAQKMLIIIWHMLTNKESYYDSRFLYLERPLDKKGKDLLLYLNEHIFLIFSIEQYDYIAKWENLKFSLSILESHPWKI